MTGSNMILSRININTKDDHNKMKVNHIGLTGMMASGKGEVVKVLADIGYRYISLSDIVREEASSSGKAVSRSEMQDIGNRLRSEGGPGILGKKIREKISTYPTGKWVIDGIRNPHEVTELKGLNPFLLVAVISKREIILKRLTERMRDTDIADIEQLNIRLDREWGTNEPEGGQQVGKCVDISDYIIENNGNLNELKVKVLEILRQMEVENE